jgi:D-lactate dehydrogenase
MRIAFFDTHKFEQPFFEQANQRFAHEIVFLSTRLDAKTAALARGCDAVCCFVNDHLDAQVLTILHDLGVGIVALRCAGYNQVDLKAARDLGLPVVRVPAYSPYAVAEHAVALVLALNRKSHRAHARVREGNFALDGLVGFDLFGKCVGIVGTGRIGAVAAQIFLGFGCRVVAHDAVVNADLVTRGVEYRSLNELYARADIISLHVPLNPQTRYMIDASAIERMKPGVMLINTGRGALIDSRALIAGLKNGRIGYAGLDVYEEEEGVFFEDLSAQVLQDDVLARLLTFPNVLVTSHQAFLTQEALGNIAQTTLQNLSAFASGAPLDNQVSAS